MLKSASVFQFPKGFRYLSNFITDSEKQELLNIVMNNPWCSRLRRQQQYYGIKYFQTKYLDSLLQSKESIGHLPLNPFNNIIRRLKNELNIKSFV